MKLRHTSLSLFFLFIATPFVMAQNSNIDQEIIIQRLLNSLENKKHQDALLQIDKLRQIDPMLSGEILYYEANSANATGNKKRAERAARKYVENVGKNGSNYSAALSLLVELQRELEAQEAIKLEQEQRLQLLRKAAEDAERNRQAEAQAERSRQQAIAAEAKHQQQAAQQAEKSRIARAVEPAVKSIQVSMKEVPSGTFMMGSDSWPENPVRQVTVKAFRLMEHEVTFAQWDACVAAGVCSWRTDMKWGRGKKPVVNVNATDILDDFIPWLNKTTGQIFRLPTEAEWEYAARAGTTTEYSWGNNINCTQARYGRPNPLNKALPVDCGNEVGTAPVKSFKPNAFGLFDMHGNVGEMVQDCIGLSFNNYEHAPTDGRSSTSLDCKGFMRTRLIRGGGWHSQPNELRSAYRVGYDLGEGTGFRLAQDIW